MDKARIFGISPFFIVKNVPLALAFYQDYLGFEITFRGFGEDDIFFGIVQRDVAMIILKDIGVDRFQIIPGMLKKVLHAGTPTCMCKILIH